LNLKPYFIWLVVKKRIIRKIKIIFLVFLENARIKKFIFLNIS